jgi:hypothetical protein
MKYKHRYRVYDTVEEYWLPGSYSSEELRERIGIHENFSKYARKGVRLRRRYKIEFYDDAILTEPKRTIPPDMLEEWERVRKEILGK